MSDQASDSDAVSDEHTAVEQHRKDRALVVDDDVSIRLMLDLILRREHFEVELARDGIEALEKIRDGHYDVIFLDLMMPRVDGMGVLRYLKTNLPETLRSVIIMTAFNNVGGPDVDEAAMTIPKPFDIHSLVEHARELIATSRDGSPSPSG
jgi:DNA-binding response OmpR family regulator